MTVVRFNKPVFGLNTLMDDLFDDFFSDDMKRSYEKRRAHVPACNILENNEQFVIELALPGYSKEEVKLKVDRDLLQVKVEENKQTDEQFKVWQRQFAKVGFEKEFSLPKTIDKEKISAKFDQGILRIVLPKKSERIENTPVEISVS